MGVFAKDAANKGQLSPQWYYKSGNSSIANGVTVVFWNQNAGGTGLFTNAPTQAFGKSGAVQYMNMYEGSHVNFLPPGGVGVVSAQVDYYAIVGAPLLP